jgi:hypothetical protein
MKLLFIDESGIHTLVPQKSDPTFPFFALAGVMFEKREYKKFQTKLLTVKMEVFGTEKVILHALELTRTARARQKKLRTLANPEKRERLYNKLNVLINNCNFSIIQFVIDKKWYEKQFSSPPDPYFLSLSYVYAEYDKHLAPREEGRVYREKTGPKLDKQFLLAWEKTKTLKKIGRKGLKLVTKAKYHSILGIIPQKYRNGSENF